MKNKWLTSIAMIAFLTGLYACGGSDGSSSQATDPSTTEMPFGISSMTVPFDGSTTTIDYIYNSDGQVVGVSATRAYDGDDDGRDDFYQTFDITIDPSTPVADIPEIDEMAGDSSPLALQSLKGATGTDRWNFEVTTTLGDLPGAVTHVESEIYSYDGDGLYGSVTGDMIIDRHVNTTYTYDANGCVIEINSTNETSSALSTYRITFTYNGQGQITGQKWVYRIDSYKDGWTDSQSISEVTYTYDASGNKTAKVEDFYDSSYLQTTTYTYDAAGMLTGEDYKQVRRSSQAVVEHETTVCSYDSANRLIGKVHTEYSIDGDGIETPSAINTYSYTYDDESRLVEKVHEYDSDADPATQNATYTDSYVYGPNGLRIYKDMSEDEYGSGSTYLYIMTYNMQGQLTEKRRAYDSNNDGTADSYRIIAYAYDDSGRLVSQTDTNHNVVDGAPDAVNEKDVYEFRYDDQGRLVGFTYSDYENGTDIDEQLVASLSYDASGTSASGTIESFSLDGTAGTLISDGPAKTLTYTFAGAATTATMAVTVEQFPHGNDSADEPFETVSLRVDFPALWGAFFENSLLPASRDD